MFDSSSPITGVLHQAFGQFCLIWMGKQARYNVTPTRMYREIQNVTDIMAVGQFSSTDMDNLRKQLANAANPGVESVEVPAKVEDGPALAEHIAIAVAEAIKPLIVKVDALTSKGSTPGS
tara:strand:+ start:101 stop:460 length:360 start_codon:yes stop_codon:yes gene_type:complete